MRSDQQSADVDSARPQTEFPGKRRVAQKRVLITPLITLVVAFALGACAPLEPGAGAHGKAGAAPGEYYRAKRPAAFRPECSRASRRFP